MLRILSVKGNLRILLRIRQTKEVKVDVKTPDGKRMTSRAASQPVGSALRIAPEFIATTTDEETGVETAIEAHYSEDEGRYIVTAIVNRAVRADFDPRALRSTAAQPILQAAIPHCIAVRLDDTTSKWTTIADLTTAEGRIIPPWMASAVAKRGMKAERMDVIEILYGAAALSGLPPVKAVQVELNVPHRTASDWIKKARDAGRLKGMSYSVGRQADG